MFVYLPVLNFVLNFTVEAGLGWCPVFVREGAEAPKGNRELVKLGAVPLPESELSQIEDLPAWLREHAKVRSVEKDLFD